MNFKIFPATINHEKQKVPLINQWRNKSSNDPNQIKLWQEVFRDRLTFFGIPCGKQNGILVLDIDVKNKNGFETIQKLNLPIPDTLYQRTPSGGAHLFFKYNPDKDPGNKVGFIEGCDLRSEGGFIIWYGAEADLSKNIAEAPDWIYEHCEKKKKELSPTSTIVQVSPEIGMEVFNNALDEIVNAPKGEGNNTLNVQSYLVGQLIAAGSIDRQYAEQELFKAAVQRGRPEYETQCTIRSAIDGGLKNPKTFDLPKSGPVPVIPIQSPIPDVPGMRDRWTPKYMTRSELFNFSNLRKQQLFEDWSTEDIHLTSADGGTGKTTLKLYEAICLALNEPFLGFQCLSPGRTLFITGEDSAAKLTAMVGAILKQMKLMDGSPENNAKVEQVLSSIVIKKDADLCLIAKDKQGFLTVNREALNKVMEAVEDLNPRMIVWDPIASFWGSESMVNDMNKAVAKFMGELQEKSRACVEMINHIGKQSSSTKDMSQFAGRGGTGLPSHSRVVRTLSPINAETYRDKTGLELPEGKSAMICNIGKFTDGSPLYDKPFIIVREGYLFERQNMTADKEKETNEHQIICEGLMMVIKAELRLGNVVTRSGAVAKYKLEHGGQSTKIKETLALLMMSGLYGEKLKEVSNPDMTVKEKMILLTDNQGNEINLQVP